MQVKEYLQALQDENRIRVEKIGSGNWYWSFASEEKKRNELLLGKLKEERRVGREPVDELEEKIREVRGAREEVEDGEREELVVRREELVREVEALRGELVGYSDNDPQEVVRKGVEAERWRERTAKWTDNVEILEGYFGRLSGGDRGALEGVRALVYGEEYVEGEGLRDLGL